MVFRWFSKFWGQWSTMVLRLTMVKFEVNDGKIYKEINCCHTVTLFFNAVFIVCWAVKLVLYNLQRNKLMLSHALSREPQDNSILLREYWFERTIDKFNGFKETIVIFNGFEETIVNFQWFLRRPSPLNVFLAIWPLPSMVFRWFFYFSTIAFNGFRWFRTIGRTMRWFRWIVVV